MVLEFIITWIITYCLIIFCLSIDNIFWIATSPEYPIYKRLPFFPVDGNDPISLLDSVKVEGKVYKSKIDYILRYRVWSVITHWRDIIPALFTSFISTIIVIAFLKGGLC